MELDQLLFIVGMIITLWAGTGGAIIYFAEDRRRAARERHNHNERPAALEMER